MNSSSMQLIRSIIRSGHAFDRLEKLILLGIAICGDSGSGAFPSVNELASNAAASRRSIHEATRRLIALGVLEIIEFGGGRHAHRYRLNRDLLEKIATAVSRAKGKAREDRNDAHAAVRKVSEQIRRDLIEKANYDPVRGPIWRVQLRRRVSKKDSALVARRKKSI